MQHKNVVLFISGCNDQSMAKMGVDTNGKSFPVYDGGTNVVQFLKPEQFIPSATVLMPNQRSALRLARATVIFNEISSPETHGITLGIAQKIISRFRDAAVINWPGRILQTTRDKVYQSLHDIPQVICPKTICVTPSTRDDLKSLVKEHFGATEVIIRETGTHGGETMRRWNTDKPDSLLDVFAIDGRSFYITEHCCPVKEK